MIKEQLQNQILPLFENISQAKAIKSSDFTEERQSNMIVVSIQNQQHLYPTLPDYKYTLKILVDSLITEDKSAVLFNKICKTVQQTMNKYVFKEQTLQSLFGENLPVVGLLYSGNNFNITSGSNQKTFNYDLFVSY